MDKECAEILDIWAKYADYNPERTTFFFGSAKYELHRVCEKIKDITENFETSGSLAIIYAKKSFISLLKSCKITVFNALNNPSELNAEKEMWEVFESDIVKDIESNFLNSCDELLQKIMGNRMLGERNIETEQESLYNSIEVVVEEIRTLNIDIFRKGDKMDAVKSFSTKVHIFETMAECLLTLETANDGMYLCFISDYGSIGGYFSFIIKSNGNIISMNDRVNEAYQGQHKHSRNGRWMEEKKYGLFPYNMIKFDGSDYKGYATRMQINDDELQFFSFGTDIYLPIVLSMVILGRKFVGDIDLPIKYSSALLKVNRLEHEFSNELINVGQSEIVTAHNSFNVGFTSEDVRNSIPSEEYTYKKEGHYSERGAFEPSGDDGFLLVKMYGKGFKVDFNALNKSNYYPRLGTFHASDEQIDSEYIGTYNRMRMQSYMDARTQLAEYMRKNIKEEYKRFGGVEAVRRWYATAIKHHRDNLNKICIERYKSEISGEIKSPPEGWESTSNNWMNCIYICEDKYLSYEYRCRVMENPKQGFNDKFICPVTGNTINIWFIFSPRNYHEIEIFVGDVPKIIKGWKKQGHDCSGNPILNAHDPAIMVGTPFERYESRRYESKDFRTMSSEYNFCFAIGFSKRGLNKLLKESKA